MGGMFSRQLLQRLNMYEFLGGTPKDCFVDGSLKHRGFVGKPVKNKINEK